MSVIRVSEDKKSAAHSDELVYTSSGSAIAVAFASTFTREPLFFSATISVLSVSGSTCRCAGGKCSMHVSRTLAQDSSLGCIAGHSDDRI